MRIIVLLIACFALNMAATGKASAMGCSAISTDQARLCAHDANTLSHQESVQISDGAIMESIEPAAGETDPDAEQENDEDTPAWHSTDEARNN